jgi:hypothetical protein
MHPIKSIYLALPLIPLSLFAAEPTATIPPVPSYRIEETLVSYHGTGTQDYLAFPAIVPSGDHEILLSYKRGKSHAKDTGAILEIRRVDLKSGRMIQDPIQLGIPSEIMQMGEWVRFPNGTLGTYIDAQKVDEKNNHERTGLLRAISRDNGKSFGPLERVGIIDGVEYGYLFDSITVGKRLYALIMTFEYLAGERRSVDALYTDDNGSTWHFIRNLNEEFGDIRINESSLLPYKKGFIVATRGYDNMQRLHQVDMNFKLIQETNITEETASIDSYIGRPRLFTYKGAYFLTGRNWRAVDRSIPMELALLRFDPKSLTVEKHFVIDNVEQGKITDGYYPCPILFDAGDRTLLNIFDYRAMLGNPPDIIRLQFDSAAFLK